jgi:hypothetical protein
MHRRFIVGTAVGVGKNWAEAQGSDATGSKRHALVDANGLPVRVPLMGANHNDVPQLLSHG